jgi:mRNA interferase RelE/StbE
LTDEPWRLVVAGPAARRLEQLPSKYASAVIKALGAIASNPQRLGKPLRFELAGRWSARRGPYRIIYLIDDDAHTVTVLAIAHRADAYRKPGRQ